MTNDVQHFAESIAGMRVVVSPILPDNTPRVKLRQSIQVSDVVKAKPPTAC